jgi:hypothetical protein
MSPQPLRCSALVALLLVACQVNPNAIDAPVRYAVASTAPSVATVAISAIDMPAPYVRNVALSAGAGSAIIGIPPGLQRHVVVRAYDGKGVTTHDAAMTVDLPKGGKTVIEIPAKARDGSSVITLDLELVGVSGAAALSVAISPRRILAEPGKAVQLTAQVHDASGAIIPNATVTWATSNPSIASVDAKGLLHATLTGSVWVTASYASSVGVGAGLSRALGSNDGSPGLQDNPLTDETIMFARQSALNGQQIYQAILNGTTSPAVVQWTAGDTLLTWEPNADNSSPGHVVYDAQNVNSGIYHLYRMPDAPLGAPILLTPNLSNASQRTPALSPIAGVDGDTMITYAFVNGDGTVSPNRAEFTLDTYNNEEAPFALGHWPFRYSAWPAYSPDGLSIVIASGNDGNVYSLERTDSAGAPSSSLSLLGLPSGVSVVHPTWSPDGQTLAFAAIDVKAGLSRIYTVSATGGPVTDITPSGVNPAPGYRDPSWSHGGTLIACTAGSSSSGTRIVAVDVSGLFVLAVTDGVGGSVPADLTPAWRRN